MSLYAREVEDTAETFRSVVEERDRLREQRDALVAAIATVPAYAAAADTAWLERILAVIARIRAEGPETGPAREACERCTPECGDCVNAGCKYAPPTLEDLADALEAIWRDPTSDRVAESARSLLDRLGRTVGG